MMLQFTLNLLHEVMKTIIEASIIVIVVIFLFLGSLRTVIIPVVTIPLSLVGVCMIMLMLGYSINILTSLAMVLAIGMVVDDAIVVVENIYRYIEEGGVTPFQAAIRGAREIATPVISMTITLAAVYAPIGLMGGITGGLFKEFAFTLASVVILSGIIALTLSPMMRSKVLTAKIGADPFVHYVDEKFAKLRVVYQTYLHEVLNHRPVIIVMAIIILTSCYFLYTNSQQELAPDEDQGTLFIMAAAPGYANRNYVEKYSQQFNPIFAGFPCLSDYFIVNGVGGQVNSVIAGCIMKPWDQRDVTQQEIMQPLQKKLYNVAGLRTIAYPLPSLPVGGSPLAIQFVLTSIRPLSQLYGFAEKLVAEARKSGIFIILTNSLTIDKPQLKIIINRSKAAQLGISMQEVGNALAAAFGKGYVNRFSLKGNSYKVIPEVGREFRFNVDDMKLIQVATADGKLIPLSTIATGKLKTTPNSMTRFQQLNSITLSGIWCQVIPLQMDCIFYKKKQKPFCRVM